MRKLGIYRNREFAGILTELSRENYLFAYEETYYNDSSKPPISLTMPKSQKEYNSPFLFPFFFNISRPFVIIFYILFTAYSLFYI